MKRTALISVSDKTKIVEFAQELSTLGYKIISTGGTAKILMENNIEVSKVSDVTDFPEIMNGRVKTLHPKIHGGILADRNNPEHLKTAEKEKINLIDMVVVNLYPFEKTINNPHSTSQEIIENIDIGGPSMIRAAAKNHKDVIIVTDKSDYDSVLNSIKVNGEISLSMRQMLAGKAFVHTANYDNLIATYFNKLNKIEIPEFLQNSIQLKSILRYGENPHQKSAFYESPQNSIIEHLHGKQLSYNNYQDIDAALRIIEKFNENPTVAIIKHTNPSGIAEGETLLEAYQKAFETDTLSPFGGIVIVNKPLDLITANAINKIFTEIILAPDFEEEAILKLKKKKNRRLLKYSVGKISSLKKIPIIHTCMGGLISQEPDIDADIESNWKIVTERKPSENEMKALKFGWKVVATLKSNAVCFTNENQTLGLGIGQTSRIDSTEIAVIKAKKFHLSLENSICASDAFFPFRDSVDSIADKGIKAIIQPGGSKGDIEVIKACNEHGIAMIFTGMRHFRH